MQINFFQGGYCTHPQAMVIRGGKWKTANFPSLFALISHPQIGAILFDTGYSQKFFTETSKFPFQLYALTTPVYLQPGESAVEQLQAYDLEPDAIKYIIISHFHADHIGGLSDFPHAKFICFQSAYQAVKSLGKIAALKAGFLAGLLPQDFEERTMFVEQLNPIDLPDEYSILETGFDIFADGSLIAVELPGHATGQLGLFLTDADKQSYFLIADACWLSRAYQEFVQPHPITNLIFANSRDYVDTLYKIHQLHKLNPHLKIIPTHCLNTWMQLQK